jgi:hypothetical protein
MSDYCHLETKDGRSLHVRKTAVGEPKRKQLYSSAGLFSFSDWREEDGEVKEKRGCSATGNFVVGYRAVSAVLIFLGVKHGLIPGDKMTGIINRRPENFAVVGPQNIQRSDLN